MFEGSPQAHAILNQTLVEYFDAQRRAKQSTPYEIPDVQIPLLETVGLESPPVNAPRKRHALHKCIEEAQLRLMALYLPVAQYGLVCCKAAKVHLLPAAGSVQNPIIESKDRSRFPGSQIRNSTFANHDIHFLHDVASQVGPHALVEKLVAQRPQGQLFVTGVTPPEVLRSARTFFPNSHHLEYEGDSYQWIPYGSTSEGYSQSVAVTLAWLRTSSVLGSNGVTYQVVQLDEKLGHTIWHIFPGTTLPQDVRMYSTGNFVRIPAMYTGTFADEFLHAPFVTGMLDFPARTPTMAPRNLAAKATQLAGGSKCVITARERSIGRFLAASVDPDRTWTDKFINGLYLGACFLTGHWKPFSRHSDVFNYVDELKKTIIIHPTAGGGWFPTRKFFGDSRAIRNLPTWLEWFSALTSSVFTFALPKVILGQALVGLWFHTDLLGFFTRISDIFDLSPLRTLLIGAVGILSATMPTYASRVVTRLAGHYWRLVWAPFSLASLFNFLVREVSGAPGYQYFPSSPGRGWCWQFVLWGIFLHELLPGIFGNAFVPLFFLYTSTPLLTSGFTVAMGCLSVFLLTTTLWEWYVYRHLQTFQALPPPLPPVFARAYSWVPTSPLLDWFDSRYVGYTAQRSALYCVQFLVNLLRFGLSEISDILPATAQYVTEGLWHSLRTLLFWQQTAAHFSAAFYSTLPFASFPVPDLPANPVAVPQAVRVRNVQVPIPTVSLQAPLVLPTPHNTIGVPPLGMTFADWFTAVQVAYAQRPGTYPALTPNMACFFDCLATLGGSAHMWYSWWSSTLGLDPATLVAPFGPLSVAEMARFSAMSGIGVSISGVLTQAHPPAVGFPTLFLTISHGLRRGMFHVVPHVPEPLRENVSALATLFGMVRAVDQRWFDELVRRHGAQSANASVYPSALTLASLIAQPLVAQYDHISEAILASAYSAPIPNPSTQFNWPFNLYTVGNPLPGNPGTWPSLMDYGPPLPALVADGRTRVRTHKPKNPTQNWKTNAPQSAGHATQVPRWFTLRSELVQKVKSYSGYMLPATSLEAETIRYSANVRSASLLAADLKSHPSVLDCRNAGEIASSLDAVIDLYRRDNTTVTVPLTAYLGTFGSGKTTALRTFLASLTPEERINARVVAHTDDLRADLKSSLDFPEFRGFNFPTLRSILTEPSNGIICFDDAGKFWGGILDLVILANPMVTGIVVNGDPGQGTAKFPLPGTQSEYVPCMIQVVAQLTTKYATISHRAPKLLADALGIHTTNPAPGFLTHTTGPVVGLPVITASPRYVQVLSSATRVAYTYDSAQGKDFSTPVEMDMTGLEGAISDATGLVGISRSKVGVWLHGEAFDPTSRVLQEPTGSDLMNAILYEMRVANSGSLVLSSDLIRATYYKHLHRVMPGLTWFAAVGYSSDLSEFLHLIPACLDTPVADPPPVSGHSLATVIETFVPEETFVREVVSNAKEHREKAVRGTLTNQFHETAFVNPPRHHRSDDATYRLGVETRLTPSSRAQNLARMQAQPRLDMIQTYDSLLPNPPQLTEEKLAYYTDLAVLEYTSKRDRSSVARKLAAHDPSRTGSDIKISMKGQTIKKAEKKLASAVPPQLIHEYDISQTIGDAPYFLFLEREIIPALPSHIQFFTRESMETFITRAPGFIHKGRGTYSSDATRWDVGCDAAMLNFDLHVFRSSGYPKDWVADYCERRLTSRSQHGVMATMQNSGDRGTWPMNTLRRAVVSTLVLHITPDDTLVVNGDDAWVDRTASADPFPDSPWVFKDLNAPTTEFSGFDLSENGTATYSPVGLLYRCWVQEQFGVTDPNRWIGYADLLSLVTSDQPEVLEIARILSRYLPSHILTNRLPPHIVSQYHSLL
jgi:hypothetical protein